MSRKKYSVDTFKPGMGWIEYSAHNNQTYADISFGIQRKNGLSARLRYGKDIIKIEGGENNAPAQH